MEYKYVIFLDGEKFAEETSFSKDAEKVLKAFFDTNQVEAEYWDVDDNGDVIAEMWTGTYTIKLASE